jgi:hypothetical protein
MTATGAEEPIAVSLRDHGPELAALDAEGATVFLFERLSPGHVTAPVNTAI